MSASSTTEVVTPFTASDHAVLWYRLSRNTERKLEIPGDNRGVILICINVVTDRRTSMFNRSYEAGFSGLRGPVLARALLRKVQRMRETFGEARTIVLAGPG